MNFGQNPSFASRDRVQTSFFGQNLKILKCWYDLENEVHVAVLHVLTFIKLIYTSALSKCFFFFFFFFFFLRICKSNSLIFRLNSNCEKEHQVNLVIYTSSPISLQRFNPLAHYSLTYRIAQP